MPRKPVKRKLIYGGSNIFFKTFSTLDYSNLIQFTSLALTFTNVYKRLSLVSSYFLSSKVMQLTSQASLRHSFCATQPFVVFVGNLIFSWIFNRNWIIEDVVIVNLMDGKENKHIFIANGKWPRLIWFSQLLKTDNGSAY